MKALDEKINKNETLADQKFKVNNKKYIILEKKYKIKTASLRLIHKNKRINCNIELSL